MWKLTSIALLVASCMPWLICGQIDGVPPKITGNFRAYGEIMENKPSSNEGMNYQIMYEENYDSETGDAEIAVWKMGHLHTYLTNSKMDKTFFIENGQCSEVAYDEWTDAKVPPRLSIYEDPDKKIRFPLRQLFTLNDTLLTDKGTKTELRGIPANMWTYNVDGGTTKDEHEDSIKLIIEVYWSDPNSNWNVTSDRSPVLLGYNILYMKMKGGDQETIMYRQFINIFGFYFDTADRSVFRARQGLVCRHAKPTYIFPEIQEFRALSFHSEIVFPDFQQIKTVDGWFDTRNKLMRLNIDKVKDEDRNTQKLGRKYVTETVSGFLGVVFKVSYFQSKAVCNVTSIANYDFDVQDLINPKLEKWTLASVFGLNDTKYIYIGKTSKRNIPCHVFQGERKDWPEPKAEVKSLWEWCIAVHLTDDDEDVIFRDNELPLVNVQITILENKKNTTDYQVGFRLNHHFYDVKVEDPAVISAMNFDIRFCFRGDNRRELQLTTDVAITDDNRDAIENATSDARFLQEWKKVIGDASGLYQESLRVSKVESTVSNDKLIIRFMLLGVHPDLPKDIKEKQKPLVDAEKSLRDKIDEGELKVRYKPNNATEEITLTAVKDTLIEQVDKTRIDVIPTVIPPETTPSPTPSKITLVTDPNADSTTAATGTTKTSTGTTKTARGTTKTATGSSLSTDTVTGSTVTVTGSTQTVTGGPSTLPPKIVYSGHQSGAVAGVTIVMLLIGIAIGSAGTHMKFKGMPACMGGR